MLVAMINASQNYAGTVNIISVSGLLLLRRETHFRKGEMQLSLPVDFLPDGQYLLSIRYGDGESILRSFSK